MTDPTPNNEGKELTVRKKVVRGFVKVRRSRLTLDQIAAQIAQDFVAAIYSAIGNRTVGGLLEGDQLDEVVEQHLDRQGMAEDLMRLSSARLEVNLGLDVSMSMFSGGRGKWLIRPAATVVRILHKAFLQVQQDLPSYVFKFNIWLWAANPHRYSDWHGSGKSVICLTSPEFSTPQRNGLPITPEQVDELLRTICESEPSFAGGGTYIAPMIGAWDKWANDYGDQSAYRLDIGVTDGALHDVEEASFAQNQRGGRLFCVLLNIGGRYYHNDLVPSDFTQYNINVLDLQSTINGFLTEFVQTIY